MFSKEFRSRIGVWLTATVDRGLWRKVARSCRKDRLVDTKSEIVSRDIVTPQISMSGELVSAFVTAAILE
jgi:hypothetical protein